MTINHHPDDSTLIAYAAGTLSEPFGALIAAHCELCARCRGAFARFNALGGALMADGPEEALDGDAFDRLLGALDSPGALSAQRSKVLNSPPEDAGDLPGPLARLIGSGLDRIAWRQALPGVGERVLAFKQAAGAHTLQFVRGEPGTDMPDHGHVGGELTLVLRGALSDGGRIYRRGDLADLGDVGTHNPIVHGDEPCYCVVANEAPPKFTAPA